MHPIETEPVEFTPAHYNGTPTAPVYLLAPLGERERLAALSRVTAEVGPQVSPGEVSDKLLEGLRVLLGADYERAESALEELATLRAQNGTLDTTQVERCAELLLEQKAYERRVAREWRTDSGNPYNALLAQVQEHEELTWLEFTLTMLRGWTGADLPPYERRQGRTSEAAFDALPIRDRTALKTQAFHMAVGLTAALQGNSARPSSSGSDPETSRAADSVTGPEAGSTP